MTTDQAPPLGTTVAGKYLLESVIGEGGMGAVYRARHVLTGRKVALKWMFTDVEGGSASVQRFLREARAMGLIDHPSVIGVHDVGLEGDAAFLVMELLRGRSLREHIIEGAGLAPEHAISLLMPALEGVAAAHLAGVVHRDLKPENLFVTVGEDGARAGTKVLDFGISKLGEDANALIGGPVSPSLTRTGAVVGTPSYMAPEQIRAIRNLDGRTDIWALGAILYELLSGALPFEAESFGGLMIAIATEAPVRLDVRVPTLPPALVDAVHRALEKSLDSRWQDIEALARALEPFAPGVRYRAPRAVSTRPPSFDERMSDPAQFTPKLAPPRAARVSGDSRLQTAPAPKHVDTASHAGAPLGTTRAYPITAGLHQTPAPVSIVHTPKATRPPPVLTAVVVVAVCAVAVGAVAIWRASTTTTSEVHARTSREANDPPSATVTSSAQLAAPRAMNDVDAATAAPEPNALLGIDVPAMPIDAPDPSAEPVAATPVRRGGRGSARPSETTTAVTPTPAADTPPAPGRTGALSREEF